MNIDASLCDQWTSTPEGWQIELPAGWMQGRSAFGGLTAAAMAALGRRLVPDAERGLRSASIQLLAPVRAGATRGSASVLREGRNITFVEVHMSQEDTLVARATLVFAKALRSSLYVDATPKPDTPPPESLPSTPHVPGLMPEFTQHVDMRWAAGAPPFSGSTDAAFTGMCRYRVPLGGVEGVLALLDTWPAPALSMMTAPKPASTVTWTAHLVAMPASFEQWFTFRYETVVGADGLHTIQGHLYDASGAMLGWSEQLVVVFG